MATNSVHYYCCFVILMFFIAEGDGRWKKKNKEILQHDIDTFKVIADKIDREIYLLYETSSDENIEEDDETNQPKEKIQHFYNLVNRNKNVNNISLISVNNINGGKEIVNKESRVLFQNDVPNVVMKTRISYNWPKFEDILLEMGKRYDWKNDRWIKVKRKGKAVKEGDKKEYFHEKHKFQYRTVKLNRSKTRRNVVIAVTAVR